MPKRSQQMKAEELECQSPIRNGIFTLLMQSSNPDLIYTKAFYFDLSDFQHMIDNKVEMIRIEVPSRASSIRSRIRILKRTLFQLWIQYLVLSYFSQSNYGQSRTWKALMLQKHEPRQQNARPAVGAVRPGRTLGKSPSEGDLSLEKV